MPTLNLILRNGQYWLTDTLNKRTEILKATDLEKEDASKQGAKKAGGRKTAAQLRRDKKLSDAVNEYADDDGKEKTNAMLRRMGMTLSIFGAAIFSTGLATCWQNTGEAPFSRTVLIPASGIMMLITGLYLWRSAKATG